MPLYLLNVLRADMHMGDFVIDAPPSIKPQILSGLTQDDEGQICMHLGLVSRFSPGVPQDVSFHFSSADPVPELFSERPTFTSSRGHRIWIRRKPDQPANKHRSPIY